MKLIDPELLRTFLAFVNSGSLAKAAEIVGRSPSAVTSQMQRLEETLGETLLAPHGRGRGLTPAGDDLVIQAQRILDVNRDVWLSLKGARADGRISIGATQDFSESTFPVTLREFARTHPRVKLELRIGRSAELLKAYNEGALDLLIAMRQNAKADSRNGDEIAIIRDPMLWLGAQEGLAIASSEVPLALLDPPCGFRSAAIAALEAASHPFRIAATSGTLSGLKAAVRGGLAVTLRTERWMEPGIVDVSATLNLPKMRQAEFSILLRQGALPAAEHLALLLKDALVT